LIFFKTVSLLRFLNFIFSNSNIHTQLKNLHLSNNRLTHIPNSIKLLTNLESITLSGNISLEMNNRNFEDSEKVLEFFKIMFK
jgi:Leucine-rich repeat (LRR) protein